MEGVDMSGFGFSNIFICGFSRSLGKKVVQVPMFAISLALMQPAYSPLIGHDHSNQFEIPGNLFFVFFPLSDSTFLIESILTYENLLLDLIHILSPIWF